MGCCLAGEVLSECGLPEVLGVHRRQHSEVLVGGSQLQPVAFQRLGGGRWELFMLALVSCVPCFMFCLFYFALKLVPST